MASRCRWITLSMNATEQLLHAIETAWPHVQWNEQNVVIAVSGGPDSIALMKAMSLLQPHAKRLIVAHYNHALRGIDSELDQQLVMEMATSWGMTCVVARSEWESSRSPSEDDLRKLRRDFLKRTAIQCNARWIALAHHADDQVETFVHHLLRGSGPRGLAGMPTVHRDDFDQTLIWIRPMLQVRRRDILSFLEEQNQPFRLDASNSTNDFTRNRIRNELLPWLREFMGSDGVDQRLLQASCLIREEHTCIELQAIQWLAEQGIVIDAPPTTLEIGIAIPIASVRNNRWPIIQQAFWMCWQRNRWPLREMSFQHWQSFHKFIDDAAQTTHRKRIQFPGGIVAVCRKGMLTIQKANEAPSASQR
jgi:tRNA(Ile)-lysidine synthase